MKATTDKKSAHSAGGFDAVKFMREQRKKLREKLSKMTNEEIVEYFRQKKLGSPVKPSA